MSDEQRAGTDRRIGPGLPVLAVLAAGALLVVGIVGLGRIDVDPPDWRTGDAREPFPRPTRMITNRPTIPPGESDGSGLPTLSIPWDIALVVLLVVVMLVAAIVLRQLRATLRARGRSLVVGGSIDDVPDTADELRKAVKSAGEALAREEVAGPDAVIEAWLILEAAAAASGVRRRQSQTPSEFTTQLLRRHHADPAATTRLRDLYHRARFSSHPQISRADVQSARQALATILDTLDIQDTKNTHGAQNILNASDTQDAQDAPR